MSGDIGPGTLVICVDASPNPRIKRPPPLVEGRCYTVAEYLDEAGLPPVVRLVEVNHAPAIGGFSLSRFRKLNDGEDDAELIARIRQCNPVRERIGA